MRKNLISILFVLFMVFTLLPALVTAEAADTVSEQFTGITPGETYYFDLSGEVGNIGTVNPDLPDYTLHYVPFIYAGTVNAYSLKSRSVELGTDSLTANNNTTDPGNPIGYRSDRSLFIAKTSVGLSVKWETLNGKNLIFGKNFSTHYQLRSLSVGDAGYTNNLNDEWKQIKAKAIATIGVDKWFWGQDAWYSDPLSHVAHSSGYLVPFVGGIAGFRPALEVLNPGDLGAEGLKEVILNLNGGSLSGDESIKIICAGTAFTAPSGEGLTKPEGMGFYKWKDSYSDTTYAVGGIVPNSVTGLTALWIPREDTPNATFAATGPDTGTLSGVDVGMEYQINSGEWEDNTSGANINLTGLTTCTISVIKRGNGTTTLDSIPQVIAVTKATRPTLTATLPSTIGGLGSIPMTAEHEYSINNGSTWTTASGTTSFDPGTYLVRFRALGSSLTSDHQTIILTAFIGTPENMPGATFTATGPNTGTLSGVDAGMGYKLSYETSWIDIDYSDNIDLTGLSACTISVIKKGNGSTTFDSIPQDITVTKATSPTLTATQPSTVGGKGSIPMTAEHEYSSDNGSTWTTASGTTNLDPGTYLVRVRAESTGLSSGNQVITINAYTTPTPPGGGGGESIPTPEPTEGTVEITQQTEDALAVELKNDSEELKSSVLTPEEQGKVAGGENAKIVLTVKDISTSISNEEKKLIQEKMALEKGTSDLAVLYVDLSLYKQIGSQEPIKVTETKNKIRISIEVPDEFRNTIITKNREYYVIRIHEGKATRIDGTVHQSQFLYSQDILLFSQDRHQLQSHRAVPGDGAYRGDRLQYFFASDAWHQAPLWHSEIGKRTCPSRAGPQPAFGFHGNTGEQILSKRYK